MENRPILTTLPPLKHQQEAFNRFHDQPYGAFFCEMGTGKTKIILDLLVNSEEQGALVLAPNGLHYNWAISEIPKHVHPTVATSVYCWNGTPSSKVAKQRLKAFMAEEDVFKIFLMNVEAIRTKSGFGPAEAFLKSLKASHIVIDESTCIKNPKAVQTKAAFSLAKLAPRKWILNGTPITQGPLDLFSQAKFLDPKALPYSSYTAFKSMFAQEERITLQNRSFNKIVGYKNIEMLTQQMKPFSLKLDKEDCLDLPDKLFTERAVMMTDEQNRAYRTMRDLCLAEMSDGTIVTAQEAITKLLKLHQILTGFTIDEFGEVHDIKNNRITTLLDIAEASQPLVIFCAYRYNVWQVRDALEEKFGQSSVVTYYGGTSGADRKTAVEKFQSGTAKFFIGTSAAAKGLTLHKAHTMVYYSLNYSLETRLQSQDRIHRIGQSKKCTYIDLVTPNTIDQQIQKALAAKKDLATLVLSDLRALL